jgi:hypothetical protein
MSSRPDRRQPRKSATVRRLVAAGTAALAFGLPAAITLPAHAAETRVLDSCVATVTEGGQLALSPAAVTGPIVAVLTPLDPLNVLVPAFRTLWAQQPPILLPGGQAVITGDQIATAVLGRLQGIPLLSSVIDTLAGPLREQLRSTCAITVTPAPPPGPPAGSPPAGSTPAPGSPGAPGSAPASRQPVSADAPGTAATLLPGYVLGSVPGVPGEGGLPPDGIAFNYDNAAVPQADAQRLALANSPGTAVALPSEVSSAGPWRPAVLAALVLTLVGTQWLRVWLLRRQRSDH